MSSDKNRLYMAFFKRATSQENPIPYHTAFLLAPKNPNKDSQEKNSRLFHVRNRLEHGGNEIWVYDGEPKRCYTINLSGLVLLGKVPATSGDVIYDVLERVPRLRNRSDNPSWHCRHWVWAAVPAGGHIPCKYTDTDASLGFSCKRHHSGAPFISSGVMDQHCGDP